MPTALQMLCHSERFADTEAARASVERMCEHRIRMVRTLLSASPEYLARAGAPETPRDLDRHDWFAKRDCARMTPRRHSPIDDRTLELAVFGSLSKSCFSNTLPVAGSTWELLARQW
jgi:hypothetical protein